MKLKLPALLTAVLLSAGLLAGCGSADSGTDTGSVASQISSDTGSGSSVVSSETGSTESSAISSTGSKTADDEVVDLTKLSATMVYAEVYNMMITPDDYMGKTVIMRGSFAMTHDDTTDKDYFACIIQDATACCSQGIEFELKGDPVYPDDYPEEGTEITVKGTFDTYTENGDLYRTLRNAEML